MKNSSKNSIKRAESVIKSNRCGFDGLSFVTKTVANIAGSRYLKFNEWMIDRKIIARNPHRALLELERLAENDLRYQKLTVRNPERIPVFKWNSDPFAVSCDT